LAIESAADFVRATRAALAASGFVRKEVGETIYFDNVIPSVARDLLGRGTEHEHRAPPKQVPRYARDDKNVVLLHGASDHAGTWFTIAPTLAKTRRVILPDLPGHGESEPREGPIPISLIVRQVEAVVDEALGDERFTLVGNSLGGFIALLYALKHPDRIAHLVLEASGGLSRPPAVPLVARTREEAIPILRAVHGPNYEAPEWVIAALIERANGSPMLRLTEILEHDVEPRLGEISVPTTLLWGEHDGVLPLSYGEALRDAIPNAQLRVIEGAAHIPHMQQPERVLQCLTSIS
jgi:pimeloyl-ACP methyl ester carboxylesterase